ADRAQPGDVGAGSGEIGDDARFYRVGDLNEDDRNRAGRLFGRERRLGRARDDQVDRKADELGREARQRFGAALGEAPVDGEGFPPPPSEGRRGLWGRGGTGGGGAGRAGRGTPPPTRRTLGGARAARGR